ncbi:MAG: hypothetical protein VR64_16825 [Desulfatitalea sp. BRH_c12]|nr:MAG: hypothetical protein VR64_16825 [Desulfatitalea sp. BRH_c12]
MEQDFAPIKRWEEFCISQIIQADVLFWPMDPQIRILSFAYGKDSPRRVQFSVSNAQMRHDVMALNS